MTVGVILAAIGALTHSVSAVAAEDGKSGQSLEQAANNPTASLIAVQIQNNYSGAFHQLDDEDSNTVVLRPVVPFKTGPLSHFARATVPYVTHSPSGKTRLGDSVLFDVVVFNEHWGRWGVGPVMMSWVRKSGPLDRSGR